MKKIIILGALCLSFFGGLVAQTSQILQDRTKISVVGTGSTSTFPNAAHITLVIRFVKPTLRESLDETQKTERAVNAIIQKYIADTFDIRTSLIATDKSFKWSESQKKDIFVGFESYQKVIFTLRDLGQMLKLTEELLKTRINEIERVSYFHTDAANFYKKAQDLAVVDARETTERLAKAANIKLGKIYYMQTSGSPNSALNTTLNSQSFQTYNKGRGGQGISSSGQLIYYNVNVTMYTEIE
jgi:uncharacterized protein